MSHRKYYRNRQEIAGIDPEALWYLNGDKLILVDQDQFIEVEHNPELFYQVDLPPGQKELL